MLDLSKFVQEKRVVMPLVNGKGKYQDRRIEHKTEDGWYSVLLGNKVIVDRKATALEVIKTLEPMKKIQVYALGTEGIPLNFDNFKRRGLGEAETVHFMNLPAFTVASAVIWEDNNIYFYGQLLPKGRKTVQDAQEAFEGGQNLLGVRGITPELRYYVLLCNLQRETYEAMEDLQRWSKSSNISDIELSKRFASFQSNFAIRLQTSIEKAGGTYISHTKKGKGFQVTWKVGGQTLKTDIRDDLRIVSAGFCLSGDDKKHTMNSIIGLAKLFQSDSPLYITRE